MEAALLQDLSIALAPEILDEGSPEERATFGLFSIRTEHGSLTEGFDFYLNGLRAGPLVSGYHAAEWFAWNWWRLRWEGRSSAARWSGAHCMTSIGEGYVWPTVTILSDGLRTALVAEPSTRPDAKPFRYLGSVSAALPSTLFEAALDEFIPRITGRLRSQDVAQTNLDRVWQDVLAERAEPEVARRRRLEALLGRDPDEVEDDAIETLLRDAARLGEQAVDEIAAAGAHRPRIPTAEALKAQGARGGRGSLRDALRLRPDFRLPYGAKVPAWQVGAAAAKAVRKQERLGAEPIDDSRLTAMAGTGLATVRKRQNNDLDLSFSLDDARDASRIVLRSKWPTGRRFDLARLLGDRLMAPEGALRPATRAYTYRQKAQRSFAAELLCPFETVEAMMDDDDTIERQQEVAEHFDVSAMAITTLLTNHARLDRVGSNLDFDGNAA